MTEFFLFINYDIVWLQNNSPQLQPKFNEMLSSARRITSSEFLLSLKVIDIADRNTMRQFLLFLLEHVQLKVGPLNQY